VPTIINFPQNCKVGLELLERTHSTIITVAFFCNFNAESVSRDISFVWKLGCRLEDRRDSGSSPQYDYQRRDRQSNLLSFLFNAYYGFLTHSSVARAII
jgi:hypothetical protein